MTQGNNTANLGPDCSVRLRCRACRSSHVLSGPIEPGRHVGDVIVDGYTFSVEDIEIVWNRGGRGRFRLPRLSWRILKEQPLPPQ